MNKNLVVSTEAFRNRPAGFSETKVNLPRDTAPHTVLPGPAQAAGQFDLPAFKARQKATWESGDFGQVAKHIMPAAEEFIGRLRLRPGMKVLDVACGSGNLALVAARGGCMTAGVDIATNLLA